ncbi:hypothetical protein AW168_06735 [Nocardia brasiliensis]|uniref:Uncharacterized protein n=2 Tax=Nocardia brasiliensis TaxID=37326 RepID=K0EWW7_NOCB7|nr:hypothetical protein O3I_031845 [Nocardia brasiliensis ATCC 700358]OCF91457.1 hypothetical protein AW168_06735 [Nocardia brasiliensis]
MEAIRLPQLGKFADLDRNKLSQEWLELAEAIRDLIGLTGLSCRAIVDAVAERLKELKKELGARADEARADEVRAELAELKSRYLSKSVLADLANGKRKRPKAIHLRELHSLALVKAGPGAVISWDDLERLRERAAAKPAERTISAAAITPVVAPVPHSEGDRRKFVTPDVAWPPAKDLAVYISVGNFERANGLIRYVGSEASPAETANAVISCRDLGMAEATEAIITYAGNRSERDVLRILHSLKQHDRRADADALLDNVLARAS